MIVRYCTVYAFDQPTMMDDVPRSQDANHMNQQAPRCIEFERAKRKSRKRRDLTPEGSQFQLFSMTHVTGDTGRARTTSYGAGVRSLFASGTEVYL